MRMSWLGWLFVAPVLLAIAVFLYWQVSYPSYTYRFKLTVEVETPEGLRKGSSVYEVEAGTILALNSGFKGRKMRVRGEAVAVDLPNGQTLFALLATGAHHGDMGGLSMAALDPAYDHDYVASAKRLASGKGVKSNALISPMRDPTGLDARDPNLKEVNNYPILVVFEDIDVPASVRRVYPDDLQTVFGEGYAIKEMAVHLTNEPVTIGLIDRLPWLVEYKNFSFAGSRYSRTNTLADSLRAGSFSTELIDD